MIKNLIALALVSTLALPTLAAKEDAKESFKVMHAADLAGALKSDRKPAVYDANTAAVRKKNGVIPGAKLISFKKPLAKQLPAAKSEPLVFYCVNTMCTASHEAAETAMKAGYTDVSVMVDGIMGWKDSGQPTKKP